MVVKFLFQAILITITAFIVTKSLKLKKYSLIYLCSLPFLIFYQDNIQILVFTLLFGTLLSLAVFRPSSFSPFLVFFSLLFFFIIFRPQLGIIDYPVALHFINQQRGEHLNLPLSALARLFHNKISLSYTLVKTFQEHLSPITLFAQAKYKLFDSPYLLGQLFPYDVVFLMLALQKTVNKRIKRRVNPSVFFIILFYVFAILFFQNESTKYIFSHAIVYFLAVYIARYISKLTFPKPVFIIILNFIFLALHFFLDGNYIVIL